jgi:hypothetical protein
MRMMHWYNPKSRLNEEVPAPMSDAQAIELLSGDPDSDEFIEEYRRWRATQPDVVETSVVHSWGRAKRESQSLWLSHTSSSPCDGRNPRNTPSM